MSLVRCYECHSNVSDLAEACPNCGAPYRRKNNLFVGQHYVYFSTGNRVCKIDKDTGRQKWVVQLEAE
jgi:outer membrane protein assembly factor BamB